MIREYSAKRRQFEQPLFNRVSKLNGTNCVVGFLQRPKSSNYMIQKNLYELKRKRYLKDVLKHELLEHCFQLKQLLQQLKIPVETY